MVGMIAFAVDLGYIVLVRTQLQVAADSSALAAAANMANPADALSESKKYAALNEAGNKNITLADSDIEFGVWDTSVRAFTASKDQSGNAIRVTAKRNSTTGANELFFGKIFGQKTFNASASAVAMANPRDICLVVDLSGSMNDDTEPGYTGTGVITGDYASIKTEMMQDVFTDFGFGTYPGTQQSVGSPLGVSNYSSLIASGGPLTKNSVTYGGKTYTITSTYKILTSATRRPPKKQKAYKWMIDYQIASIMPNVKPTPVEQQHVELQLLGRVSRCDYVAIVEQSVYRLPHLCPFYDVQRPQYKPDGTDYTELTVSSPNCHYHTDRSIPTRSLFLPANNRRTPAVVR